MLSKTFWTHTLVSGDSSRNDIFFYRGWKIHNGKYWILVLNSLLIHIIHSLQCNQCLLHSNPQQTKQKITANKQHKKRRKKPSKFFFFCSLFAFICVDPKNLFELNKIVSINEGDSPPSAQRRLFSFSSLPLANENQKKNTVK